jgi:hypothetical protein
MPSKKPKSTSKPTPSKDVILDHLHATSTKGKYRTYQNQFIDFCQKKKNGLDPKHARPDDCTDFFYFLVSDGKSARTVDSAKTSFVNFFKDHNINPNPAQDLLAKKYVVALQKYNRHGVTVHVTK